MSPWPLKSGLPQVAQQFPAMQTKKLSMSASVAISPSNGRACDGAAVALHATAQHEPSALLGNVGAQVHLQRSEARMRSRELSL
jgi:hypothetical protein